MDLFRIVDIAWIFGGLWYVSWYLGIPWGNAQFMMGLLATAVFTIFAGLWPLYRSWRVAPLRAELSRAGVFWLGAIAAVSLVALVIGPLQIAHSTLIPAWGLCTLFGVLVTRAVLRISLRTIRLRGGNFRTAVIVGVNDTGMQVAHTIRHTSWMGLHMVGFYDDRCGCADGQPAIVDLKGNFDDLLRDVRAGEVDIIYITLPLASEGRIRDILMALRDTTITVYYVPDFAAFGLLSPHWDSLAGMPIVSLIDTPHQGVDALSKRVFDIVLSSLILLALAIPMLLIAAAVKTTSRGPVIFRQQRYGLEGKPFVIWKFRTMTLCEDGKDVFTQATKNDARTTPLGAILRRTSLDELPQFINVLQGRMSIVGPRPHPIAMNEVYRKHIDGYMLRHKVKPGITGWAQINGCRGETDTAEKMRSRIRYDLEYINNWSLGLDLRIVVLTLARVLADPNAY